MDQSKNEEAKYGNIAPSFDMERTCLADVLPLETPFTVILDASELCNFKCGYCFRARRDKSAWGYAAENGMMSESIFKTAVSQLRQFPGEIRQISLSHHGEPLTNRKLPWMAGFIKDMGIKGRISIHTNGSLLTPGYARELAEAGIDRVVVSLQGLSAERYREVCGYNIDYESFYCNLQYFYNIKKNTQIYIKIIDTALDEGEEERFFELFAPIADRVFIEKEVPIWKEKSFPESADPSEMAINKYGQEFAPQRVCPLIFHTLTVVPNGDIYPCTQLLQKEKLGNVRECSLSDAWNGNKRKEMLKEQCRLCLPEICLNCGIRQNSIYSREDMIDEARDTILRRLEC